MTSAVRAAGRCGTPGGCAGCGTWTSSKDIGVSPGSGVAPQGCQRGDEWGVCGKANYRARGSGTDRGRTAFLDRTADRGQPDTGDPGHGNAGDPALADQPPKRVVSDPGG